MASWEAGADQTPFVDPERGLRVLRYCGAADENTPTCQSSVHLHCGESLRRATLVLREDLEMRQNYIQNPNVYECGPTECRHAPMMEYDYEGLLRFDTSAEPPVLIEVLHIEGASSPEAVADWADEQRASHHGRRCAEGSGQRWKI